MARRRLLVWLLALACALAQYAAPSYDRDERNDLAFARRPAGEILGALARGEGSEPPLPLYFLGLKAWTSLAGEGEAAARLPFALATAAAAGLAFEVLLEVLGAQAAWPAALLTAANPLWAFHGTRIRPHAPGLCLALAALWAGFRWLRVPGRRGAVLSAGLALLAFQMQPLAGGTAAVPWIAGWLRGIRRRAMALALAAFAAGALLWAPVALGHWGKAHGRGPQPALKVRLLGPFAVLDQFLLGETLGRGFLTGDLTPVNLAVTGTAVLCAGLGLGCALRRRPPSLLPLGLWALLPLGAYAVLHLAAGGWLLAFYFLPAVPGLLGLIAWGCLASGRAGRLALGGLGILAAASLIRFWTAPECRREPLREVARWVSSRPGGRDVLHTARSPLGWYALPSARLVPVDERDWEAEARRRSGPEGVWLVGALAGGDEIFQHSVDLALAAGRWRLLESHREPGLYPFLARRLAPAVESADP